MLFCYLQLMWLWASSLCLHFFMFKNNMKLLHGSLFLASPLILISSKTDAWALSLFHSSLSDLRSSQSLILTCSDEQILDKKESLGPMLMYPLPVHGCLSDYTLGHFYFLLDAMYFCSQRWTIQFLNKLNPIEINSIYNWEQRMQSIGLDAKWN